MEVKIDNYVTAFVVINSIFHEHTKHGNVHYHFIRYNILLCIIFSISSSKVLLVSLMGSCRKLYIYASIL